MNYKNCTHYNEIVRVLSENLSLEDVNFKLEETKGCECEVDENSVCELWVTLAFAHDMAPQMGIEHAEQTIANLDKRMKEIATMMVSNVGNKPESIEETETISETTIDSQLFAALPKEKQQLIEQLLEMGDVTFVQSDASRNEHIVKAFAEMNITALEIFLDDTKTYQDATKEVFLEKLEELFLAHKNIGDDYLIYYPGKCGAEHSRCDNCGKTGYRFVGNHSNNYFDFIFELAGQNISDIYDCSRFETTEIIKNLESKASLDFDEDERASFVKTPVYLSKVSTAREAFSEISTTPPQLLDFEQLSYWVDKYAILSEKIGEFDIFEPIMKWTPFVRLYSDLKEIKIYLDLNFKSIQNANTHYKTLKTEQNYIDWIVNYYAVFDSSPADLKYSLTLEKSVVSCKIDNKTTLLFQGPEFLEAYHFSKNYNTKNEDMIKKYCVYNNEEYWEKFNDFYFKDDLSNLNYHLQQRDALAKIGIKIPFNIIKNLF